VEANFVKNEIMQMKKIYDGSLEIGVESDIVLPDYFEDIEHIKRSYREFAQISLANKGFVVANGDDRLTLEAVDGLEKVVLFGVENKSADVRAEIRLT
jgi:UDP-N-acetylmuramate-alanine ligase